MKNKRRPNPTDYLIDDNDFYENANYPVHRPRDGRIIHDSCRDESNNADYLVYDHGRPAAASKRGKAHQQS